MNRISFNLLPKEELLLRRQGSKISLINKLSIVCLVAMLALTALVITIRLLQRSELEEASFGLTEAEAQVTGQKGKESQLTLLKDYLTSIQTLQGQDIKRRSIFNLVIFLSPDEVEISDLVVDQSGNALLSASSATLAPLEAFLVDLGDSKKNSDLISRVELQGLALGKDGVYRFDLKIVPK